MYCVTKSPPHDYQQKIQVKGLLPDFYLPEPIKEENCEESCEMHLTNRASWATGSPQGRLTAPGGAGCCCPRPRWWPTSQHPDKESLQSATPTPPHQTTWKQTHMESQHRRYKKSLHAYVQQESAMWRQWVLGMFNHSFTISQEHQLKWSPCWHTRCPLSPNRVHSWWLQAPSRRRSQQTTFWCSSHSTLGSSRSLRSSPHYYWPLTHCKTKHPTLYHSNNYYDVNVLIRGLLEHNPNRVSTSADKCKIFGTLLDGVLKTGALLMKSIFSIVKWE